MEVESVSQPTVVDLAIIEQFCEIDKNFTSNLNMLTSTFESEALNQILREYSMRFQKVIESTITDVHDKAPGDEFQELTNTLLNCSLIWKIAHIVYLQKRDCKAKEYLRIIRQNYSFEKTSDHWSTMLALGDFNSFMLVLTTVKFPEKELNEFLHRFERVYASRDNFYSPFDTEANEYKSKMSFQAMFEKQKAQMQSLIPDYRNITDQFTSKLTRDQRRDWDNLGDCLSLLSGDMDFIIDKFEADILLMISCYMLFVDATVDEDKFAPFSKKIAQQRNQKSISIESEDDLNTDENLKYELNDVILSIFENSSDAHFFIQKCLDFLPMWMVYHLSKLLIFSKKLKNRKNVPELQNKNYYDYLVEEYLKYLIVVARANFSVCKYYYLQNFDFDRNLNLDYLKQIICLNLKDAETLRTMSENGFQSMVDRAVAKAVSDPQYSKELEFHHYILFIKYVKSQQLIDQLLEIIFKAEADSAQTLMPEKILDHCRSLQQSDRVHSTNLELYSKICELKAMLKNSKEFKLLFETASYILQTIGKHSMVFYLEVFKIMDRLFDNFSIDTDYKFEDNLIEEVNVIFQTRILKAKLLSGNPNVKKDFEGLGRKLLKLI